MEEAVKKALGTKILKDTGVGGSGCISAGSTYLTDSGPVFIKVNHESKAAEMFEGERAGLQAILDTNTIRVPKPYCTVRFGKNSAGLVMESLNIRSHSKVQGALGTKLAELHLHNINLYKKQISESNRVTKLSDGQEEPEAIQKFGFHIPTSCGYLLQNNDWEDDWSKFCIRKLAGQVNDLLQKHRDTELKDTWESCMLKVEKILGEIQPIPSLVHGDLWSGNVGSVDGEPVIYDPATFYGHHEYDFGIAQMFGGFTAEFYEAYHSKIPKEKGFEARLPIYELFHNLNHW